MAMYDHEADEARSFECGFCGARSTDPGARIDRYCVICNRSDVEYRAWLARLASARAFEPDTASRAA